MQIFTNVRRIALFVLSMVLSIGMIYAQEKTITGKVTAEGEGALPGVNVTVQGTTIGAITDVNGSFTLKVPGPTSVLLFSSIGYVTQQVTVGAQTALDVVLVSDTKALQEVVVTGYSSQRKKEITGAVGVVDATKLTTIPVGNVSNQLQGQTSGVTVTGSGQPGETAKVRIRGFASFEANDPLYVVDGVPTTDISSLNPNDVESLTVLKDAGAASVYGSRASNGVIVVTTKKGKNGVNVNYDMYAGIYDPGAGPTKDLCTAQDYANLVWLVNHNEGTDKVMPPVINPIYGNVQNATPTMPSWASNTDWYKAITRTSFIVNNDITLSGGNDKSKYFAGFGVLKQDGIIIYTHADKYTVRFNSEFKILGDRIKIGENMTAAYRNTLGVTNLGEGSPIQMGPYREQSIIPVYWTGAPFVGSSHTFVAGDYGGTGILPGLGNASNEVADLIRNKDNNYWDIRAVGSAYVDVNIIKGLNFRSTLGGTWDNGYGTTYTFSTYENSENTGTPTFNESAYYSNDWVWTNTLNFERTFGQHKIAVVAGYEAVKYGTGRDVNATRAGYFSDAVDFRTLTNGALITGANSDLYTPTTLESMFLKADYGFMNKYLVSATIRRDGASKFGPQNRYGVFPSVSAGWRISEESFLKGVTWINDLKIRGSYGTMGNQMAISPQNAFFLYGGDPSTSFYDINGTGTGSVQGFRPTQIANPAAKWETNITTNIGFEAQLLNSKVGIVFDWYTKDTKDLLFQQELPGIMGSATAPYMNIASMSNKGVDAEVSYKNTWGDFGFNGLITFTTYKNDITALAPGVPFFDYSGATSRIGTANRNEVGHPISSFFGYVVQGIFQDTTEVKNAPVQDGKAPGTWRYKDIDGNDTIDARDRTFIGNPNPKFTYGINLTFTYKGFDLTGFFYGSQGNQIFNWNTYFIDYWPSFQGQKSKALLYDSWTPTNTTAKWPEANDNSNFSTNTQVTSAYIENGSYLRLKTLQLGYTIPARIMNKVNIKSLRVYVQAVNLFTVTKYSGLDPELGGDDRAFGADTGNYPNVKQFIFGLNLKL
jgi:TonB-dependent starch-binding outer membrane protein SusC